MQIHFKYHIDTQMSIKRVKGNIRKIMKNNQIQGHPYSMKNTSK